MGFDNLSGPPDRPMTPSRIVVVGLGPGDPGAVTQQTLAAIAATQHRYLRTTVHPTADLVPNALSFDDLYVSANTFDEVYTGIANQLLAAATEHGEILYAVPGSPLVLERSVQHLRAACAAPDTPRLELLPALSFLDLAWDRLNVDPVDEGVRMIDGHLFQTAAAGEVGPLLVAHAHAQWVLSDIKLAVDAGPEQKVTVLQGLGTAQEVITEVSWPDLDRSVKADHLTCLYIPQLAAPVAHELMRSVQLMHRLRQDCPWDQEQTHASLRRHLLEETYEVLEAIDAVDSEAGEGYEHLEEELGDLWFQILFHAELATEAGQFTVADVARNVHDKLVSRHPHVFGEVAAHDAAAVLENWEQSKVAEKGRQSVMDGIPSVLPALTFAEKILKKGQRKLPQAIAVDPGAPGSESELGALLLAIVEQARQVGLDPEGALRRSALEARDRFQLLERSGAETAASNWVLG